MGLWWLLNFTSGRGILALWTNRAALPLPSQTGWQPRREASEAVLRLLPPSQSSWGRAIPQTVLVPRNQEFCQKTLLPAAFPASAGTWHSLRLPPGKALLPGMNARRVTSQNNVLPPPPVAGAALCIWQHGTSRLSMAVKAPHNLPLLTSFLALLRLPRTPPCTLHTVSCLWVSAYAATSA